MRLGTCKTVLLIAVASILGCQSIPDTDAPGGILSGNELSRQQAARGASVDQTNAGRIIDVSSPARSAGPATAPAPTTAPVAP